MANKQRKSSFLQVLWPVWLALGLIVAGAILLILQPFSREEPETVSIGQQVDMSGDVRAQLNAAGVAQGERDAPVTLYEFADYQCPACRQFHDTLNRVKGEYMESGQLRIVFLDFPLSNHAHASAAAVAARCARRQNAFGEMQTRIFEGQSDWSRRSDVSADMKRYAREAGLDEARFARCFDARATQSEVEQSASLGQRLGVRATPTVIVGDRMFAGGPGEASLRAAIAHALEHSDD